MKMTIERAALLKSLGHVQSVVERRNTIPILSNVKLEAGDGAVHLNATDMDLDIVEEAVADVATPGATTAVAPGVARRRVWRGLQLPSRPGRLRRRSGPLSERRKSGGVLVGCGRC